MRCIAVCALCPHLLLGYVGIDTAAAVSGWNRAFTGLPNEGKKRKHMPNLKCSQARLWMKQCVLLCALSPTDTDWVLLSSAGEIISLLTTGR